MTFSAIVGGIFAIAKAVPIVAEYINKFYELWVDKQVEIIDSKYGEINRKRKAVLNSIKKATTDEERKTLSIILADLNK